MSKDEITIVHYVRELRRTGEVEWASFMERDGWIIMHSQLDLKNTIASDSISGWALGLDHPSRETIHGGKMTVYASPVYRGFEPAGIALLAFNQGRQSGRVRSSLWSSFRRFGGATLVCLCVGIGMAIGVTRGLVSSLNDLTTAVRRLGAGDWQARAAVHRPDEIGELATAFGEMSRQLARVDEMKDEFITTVSHDLRNPLGAILFVKHPADRIADAVSDHAAQSSCQKDLDERIPAKKTAMGHGAGDQKRYVALNGTESKNGIDTILLNDL